MSLIDGYEIVTALNWLETALQKGYGFMPSPSQLHTIKNHEKNIAIQLIEKIKNAVKHGYQTDPIQLINIPKRNNSTFRNVPVFSVLDQAFFTWVGIKTFSSIKQTIENNGPLSDHSNPLPYTMQERFWIGDFLEAYSSFRNRESEDLQNGSHILCLDIKDFSPSIDIDLLEKLCVSYGCDPQTMALYANAVRTLQKEGQITGIPIGQISTDIFLKAYLNPIDQMAQNYFGDRYYRYVDDIRIALGPNEDPAKTIAWFDNKLSTISLSLNKEKTKLLKHTEKIHPNTHITEALDEIHIDHKKGKKGYINSKHIKKSHLKTIFSEIVMPGLLGRKRCPEDGLLKRTYQLMADNNMFRVLDNIKKIAYARPSKAWLLKYYLERGYLSNDKLNVITDICENNMSGFEQYDFVKMIAKYYVDQPEYFVPVAQKWAARIDLPDFMHHFAQDVLKTVNKTKQPEKEYQCGCCLK